MVHFLFSQIDALTSHFKEAQEVIATLSSDSTEQLKIKHEALVQANQEQRSVKSFELHCIKYYNAYGLCSTSFSNLYAGQFNFKIDLFNN